MKYDRIAKCTIESKDKIVHINGYVLVGKNIFDNLIVDITSGFVYREDYTFLKPEVVAYVSSLADVINFCNENSIHLCDRWFKDGKLLVGGKRTDLIDFDLNFLGSDNYPVCFTPFSNVKATPCDGDYSKHCKNCCFCSLKNTKKEAA